MLIQYLYALLTMIPCPLWFWSRWASGIFLATVFAWSVWNGATFYIDVFGNRFQKELEALKKDVAKWQSAAELAGVTGPGSPVMSVSDLDLKTSGLDSTAALGAKVSKETAPLLNSPIEEADSDSSKNHVPGIDGGLTGDQLHPPSKESKKVQ
jgi:hypothetical protein